MRVATIDTYSRSVRVITAFFDRCIDTLETVDLKQYFLQLISTGTHSWSTVRLDRNGLQISIATLSANSRNG